MIGGRTSIFAYGRQDSEKYERMRGNDKEKGVLIRFSSLIYALIYVKTIYDEIFSKLYLFTSFSYNPGFCSVCLNSRGMRMNSMILH